MFRRSVLALGLCLLPIAAGHAQESAGIPDRKPALRGDTAGTPSPVSRPPLGSLGSSVLSHPIPVQAEAVPYGASLFNESGRALRSDGMDADYVVATGDRLALRIWGAVSFDQVVAVDTEGKVFIPEAGPVLVAGRRAADVEDAIRAKLRSVYTSNVEVYANLLTATPVSVFVTGGVMKPGEYAGLPSDSILVYLRQAGGIDPKRGSYRRIKVLRNGKPYREVDLYPFLDQGALPSLRFERGDVVLVEDRGPVVVVDGVARSAFGFELRERSTPARVLTDLAKPGPSVTHALVSGIRSGKPITRYQPLAEFQSFDLRDGDTVTFESDVKAEVLKVRVQGDHLGPSVFAVPHDARLGELLDHVRVNLDAADLQGIHIRRKSVVDGQRKLIEESLHRLEETVLTGPASSDGEATIRAKEAELVLQFIERARGVEPEGRVVVSRQGLISDIRLEEGDVIVIPSRTDVILIGGEVLLPQALVYEPSLGVSDYLRRAGGLTERADASRIALIHANGEVDIGPGSDIRPGDRILVLPQVDTKSLQIAKDVVQVIYQVAVSAAVALGL